MVCPLKIVENIRVVDSRLDQLDTKTTEEKNNGYEIVTSVPYATRRGLFNNLNKGVLVTMHLANCPQNCPGILCGKNQTIKQEISEPNIDDTKQEGNGNIVDTKAEKVFFLQGKSGKRFAYMIEGSMDNIPQDCYFKATEINGDTAYFEYICSIKEATADPNAIFDNVANLKNLDMAVKSHKTLEKGIIQKLDCWTVTRKTTIEFYR